MKDQLVEVVTDYLLKLDEIESVQTKKHEFVEKQDYAEAAKQRILENDLHKEALGLINKMKLIRKHGK